MYPYFSGKRVGVLVLITIITTVGLVWGFSSFDPANSRNSGFKEVDISWQKYLKRQVEVKIHKKVPGVNKETSPTDIVTYLYDFEKLATIEKRLSGVDRRASLVRLFQEAKSISASSDDSEIWWTIISLMNRSLRHDPIVQPMYPDKNMVTDPLVLLELGEGRCGHVARVVVDLALANGYQARLVNVAAHLVAEVYWHNEWHMIDVDSDFPVEQYRSLFPDLPSLEKISAAPYLLDRMPARGWAWGANYRRAGEQILSDRMFYPATLTTSSVYFGDNVTSGHFYSPGRNRTEFQYVYKNGSAKDWQNDKYYGWGNLQIVNKVIPLIPTKFQITEPQIVGPRDIYLARNADNVSILLSINASYRPFIKSETNLWDIGKDYDGIDYEVIVSSKSRGWDYDYRAYDVMGNSGSGDIYRKRVIRPSNNAIFLYELAFAPSSASAVYIEVKPVSSKPGSDEFLWPSNEICVNIVRDQTPGAQNN